jgi:hypothetical protein
LARRATVAGGDDVDRLGRFLELWFGQQSGENDDPANAVGRLLRFNRPAPTGTFDGAVEVLVVENQGVWLWGRDADDRYVERENEPGVPWRQTGESTEEFWLHHAAFDAVSNLPASRSARWFDAATVRNIERATTPLPCKSWSWPGTGHSLFYRGASVLMICGDGTDFWVVASAPTEFDLGWLDDLYLTWDESDSRRDDA